MKKSLAVVIILACMLGMTACGSGQSVEANPLYTDDDLAMLDSLGENTVENMNTIIMHDQIEQYESDEVGYNGLVSFASALDEMGEYTGVKDVQAEIGEDEVVINVTAGGSLRDSIVEIVMNNDGTAKSITTSVQYSMAELMTKAGLNTLIGMGTVFAVLILICLLISLFKLIPTLQEAFSGKKKEEKGIAEVAVDNTISQIIQKEDDLELVAVITAAIAASEGAASTDGYVVRSIRRR